MANKISNFAEGDVNLTAIMQTINAAYKGLHQLSFVDPSNKYIVPEIAAGSVIEVNGALYNFEENEGITGDFPFDSDDWRYVMMVPSSDSNSNDFIYAEYTTVVPTWDTEKQGFYGTGVYANCRSIGHVSRFYVGSGSGYEGSNYIYPKY